ncbi:transporter substrate-binding domain-containing protein [Actinomadura sp. 3N407]|uniref:transporter substrate-binding domain-containing protein n=1 Tax=Actinomadura sp. 3N407 TaxID=3457423 RepID=UPI003FCE154C
MVEVTGPATRPAGRVRRAATAVLVAAPVLAAGACGTADAADSLLREDVLAIGVQTDQPGLGRQIPGAESGRYDSYEGFDVRMAKEIARNLGFPARKVSFSPVSSKMREEAILSGQVDLVVGSYSVTPERKTKVGFAGPYYVAHQDILVREANPASIRNLHDLAGKRLCTVPGSQSFHRVRTEQSVPAVPVEAKGYTDCLGKLIAGELDAVSTDDLILAGLASMAARTGDYMKLVNAPFSDERYGVGLLKDDVDGCEAVNEAITKMYQDDTVRLQLNRWFGPTGLELTTTVPQFEGCI